MTTYMPAAQVAKLVRAELKVAFPGIKFSVRTDHGTTLNIEWTDGPADKTVSALVDKYAGQSFDGMQDMRVYTGAGHKTEDGEDVTYGTDFVFTRRNISPEQELELRDELATEISMETGTPVTEVLQDHRFWDPPQTILREVHRGADNSLYVFVRQLAEARAEAQDQK